MIYVIYTSKNDGTLYCTEIVFTYRCLFLMVYIHLLQTITKANIQNRRGDTSYFGHLDSTPQLGVAKPKLKKKLVSSLRLRRFVCRDRPDIFFKKLDIIIQKLDSLYKSSVGLQKIVIVF